MDANSKWPESDGRAIWVGGGWTMWISSDWVMGTSSSDSTLCVCGMAGQWWPDVTGRWASDLTPCLACGVAD